jgi:hypothetical protein
MTKNNQIKEKAWLVKSKNINSKIIYAVKLTSAKSIYCKTYKVRYIDLKAFRSPENDVIEYNGVNVIRKDLHKLIELMLFKSINVNKNVYIWNTDLNMYWRENAGGYTNKIVEAGIYHIEDAFNNIKDKLNNKLMIL